MFFFFVYPKLDARNPLNEVQAEQKFNHQYLWLHLILLQYLICKKKKRRDFADLTKSCKWFANLVLSLHPQPIYSLTP